MRLDTSRHLITLFKTGDPGRSKLVLRARRESQSGNQMYYAESAKAKSPDLHFEVIYDVVRHERLTLAPEDPPEPGAAPDGVEVNHTGSADRRARRRCRSSRRRQPATLFAR